MVARTTRGVTWSAVLAGASLVLGTTVARAPEGPPVDVIVTGDPARIAGAVEATGGVVTGRLELVGGVTATLPEGRLGAVRHAPGVETLTVDGAVRVQGQLDSKGLVRSVYGAATHATTLSGAGVTGEGVTVALIDTGVADVPDLAGRVRPVVDPVTGRTAPCVDFSGEGHCGDSYGHGTFMAGIIIGDGSASDGKFVGMAPGADLVSLKVAGRDGSSDVSTVIAAIQWAVANAERHGIRVINLSLGTDATQSWEVDPFNYAVERAWDAGITVIVSASNFGPAPGTIAKPGDDPWVVTVGAVDDRGTVATADDRLPDFTSRGPTADGEAKPDIVAPGARVVSLRAPGSAVDEQLPGVIDAHHRRGSGTSMATAVVSGGAALLLERNPTWTPDQVKEALRSTAQRSGASDDPLAVGAGLVDLAAADGSTSAPTTVDRAHSSGLGRLDASRGSVRVRSDDLLGTVLDSTLTAQLLLWDPAGFTTGGWDSETMATSSLLVHRWRTTTWQGNSWQGNSWQGNSWQGDWSGATTADGGSSDDEYGKAWLGAAWYGLWG
ncbi:MAG: S8 family peptidase [Actinomycetota bacterium]|nr:S8 family peptidase [Actinomycetota bacterium]